MSRRVQVRTPKTRLDESRKRKRKQKSAELAQQALARANVLATHARRMAGVAKRKEQEDGKED